MTKTTDKLPHTKIDDLGQRARLLIESDTFRLAANDPEFLEHDDLRSVRLQLEYLKPEWTMRQQGVISTIIVFGSARLRSKGKLAREIKMLQDSLQKAPKNKALLAQLEALVKRKNYTRFYDEARKFSAIVSKKFQETEHREFVMMTGGGPGIMEAANRGGR